MTARWGLMPNPPSKKLIGIARETKLIREMTELLSEYGVDRAGINAAVDIAIAYSEGE